jgi:hypothetical protein
VTKVVGSRVRLERFGADELIDRLPPGQSDARYKRSAFMEARRFIKQHSAVPSRLSAGPAFFRVSSPVTDLLFHVRWPTCDRGRSHAVRISLS